MAKAFGWPADPRAESGQKGFDGVHVCCTAKPFDRLDPGMHQHAVSNSGGKERLALVQACEGDDDGAARKLVHEVLASALREKTGSAPPAHRAKVAKQEFNAEIMWPPLLLIKGMVACGPACGTSCSHSNSSGKLTTRFELRGGTPPALAAPEFNPRFMGNAVLGFRTENFEQAKQLMDHLNLESTTDVRSAEWVDRVKWDDWKEKSKKHWSKSVLKWGAQVNIAPVNLHAKERELIHATLKEKDELKKTQADVLQLTDKLATLKEATAKTKEGEERLLEQIGSAMTEIEKQQCALP